MASFPTLNMSLDSGEDLVDDLRVDRTTNGTAKSRSFFTGTKRRFTPKFRLTRTERDTLTTFYNTNKLLNFNFTWGGDGVVYVCRFESAPRYSYQRGLWVNVECALVEV